MRLLIPILMLMAIAPTVEIINSPNGEASLVIINSVCTVEVPTVKLDDANYVAELVLKKCEKELFYE